MQLCRSSLGLELRLVKVLSLVLLLLVLVMRAISSIGWLGK